MANPNIVNLTALYGKTEMINLTTTAATQVVSNASASGTVLKINSIYVANVDGSNSADITISMYSAAALAGTAYPIVSTVSIPADSSLVVVERNSGIYITEDRSIGATASAANDLMIICSYEEIS
jgi:hypothetical protein